MNETRRSARRPGAAALPSVALMLRLGLAAALSTGGARGEIPGFSAQPIPMPPDAFVGFLTRGAYGDVFYADENGFIGNVRPDGTLRILPVPGGAAATVASGIAFGPDGALWFLRGTSEGGVEETRMARWSAFDPEAAFSTIPLPTPGGGGGPVVVGPDGALWYAQPREAKVGRVTIAGEATEIALPRGSLPNDLVPGPDGKMWVVLETPGRIATIDGVGGVQTLPLPTVSGRVPQPGRITSAGGRILFTDAGTNSVWAMTPGGEPARFAIPSASSEPYGLAAGSGSNFVYFAERVPDAIGRLDLSSGRIDESPMPPIGSPQFPHEILLSFPAEDPAVDAFLVASPLLFRAAAPAAPPGGGTRLSVRLAVDDGSGGPAGAGPSDGTPFRYVASVRNSGDVPSGLDLLVSMILPETVELVSTDGCSPGAPAVLLCSAASPVPAGGEARFSAVVRLRAGAPAAAAAKAFLFGGGDPAGPRAASVSFGRSMIPVPGPETPARVEGRR